MSNTKIQTGKFFQKQPKNTRFNAFSQGDGGIRAMQVQAAITTQGLKDQLAYSKERGQQQIDDFRVTASNAQKSRDIVNNHENEKLSLQLRATQRVQEQDLTSYQTLIDEAKEKENYWRWFTETGAEQWKETWENLIEAEDILRGKREIRDAEKVDEYNKRVGISSKAKEKVQDDIAKLLRRTKLKKDAELTDHGLAKWNFSSAFAKGIQAQEVINQKDILLGKISDLRDERKIPNDPKSILDFYDTAAVKTLKELNISAFTEEGQKIREIIQKEGASIATFVHKGQIYETKKLIANTQKTNFLNTVKDGTSTQKNINSSFSLAVSAFENIKEVPTGQNTFGPADINKRQIGVNILTELAKSPSIVILGESAGTTELQKIISNLPIYDSTGKKPIPGKNWWNNWKGDPSALQEPIMKAFGKAVSDTAAAEEAIIKSQDKTVLSDLKKKVINGKALQIDTEDGATALKNLRLLASQKGWTKTVEYIKKNYPHVEDAANGKVNWDQLVRLSGARGEGDALEISHIIESVPKDQQREYFNTYLTNAEAYSGGRINFDYFNNNAMGHFRAAKRTLGQPWEPDALEISDKKTIKRIGDYEEALYLQKAQTFLENDKVEVDGKTIDTNLVEVRDAVTDYVRKMIIDSKNDSYSIFGYSGGSTGTTGEGGSLLHKIIFNFDQIGNVSTASELTADLSKEKISEKLGGVLNNIEDLDKILGGQIDVNDPAQLDQATQTDPKKINNSYGINVISNYETAKMIQSLSRGEDLIYVPKAFSTFVNNLPVRKYKIDGREVSIPWTIPEVANYFNKKRGIKLQFPPSIETQLLQSNFTGNKIPRDPDNQYSILMYNSLAGIKEGEENNINKLPMSKVLTLARDDKLDELIKNSPLDSIEGALKSYGWIDAKGKFKPYVPQLPKKFKTKVAGE